MESDECLLRSTAGLQKNRGRTASLGGDDAGVVMCSICVTEKPPRLLLFEQEVP